MKVEVIKQELFRLIADYEKCFEDPNRKNFYAPVLTPISRNTFFAIKEVLSRMDKTYRKAKKVFEKNVYAYIDFVIDNDEKNT